MINWKIIINVLSRIAERVYNGGHRIPNDIIERRYSRGISNHVRLYILFKKNCYPYCCV
jgi:predicted ABC-type ATPase